MTERPLRNFRMLFAVILVYLVIVNGVAYWQSKNGDHFYVCVSPSQQTYVLATAHCSKGECTSEERDAVGEVRLSAEYTAGTVYTNNATDNTHSGCVEITRQEAELLAPVAAHGEAITAAEAGIPDGYDAVTTNLAYIRSIDIATPTRMITFDPMKLSGGPGSGGEEFVFENDDTTTVTLPLADDAGPYFITYNGGGENVWRTMLEEQIHELIAGADVASYLPDYYSPYLTGDSAVFHVVQENGVVTKVIQKYFP